jgi:hypothetical protein
MRRPSTALMRMGGISRYCTCTPMNTSLSIARTMAATHRERRVPVEGGGDDRPDRAGELEKAEGGPADAAEDSPHSHICSYVHIIDDNPGAHYAFAILLAACVRDPGTLLYPREARIAI